MIFELREKPGSDVAIKEFFAKFGLENFWIFLRTNILGDTNTFIFTLLILLFIFGISHKYESIFLEIISGISFFALIIFKLIL